jgi:transcriptional regulator PpsR
MDHQPADEFSRSFASQQSLLGDLGPAAILAIAQTASDITLVLNADGTVIDVAYRDRDLSKYRPESWIGRLFAETVTLESLEKVEALLADAARNSRTRARQVNHPAPGFPDLPVSYALLSFPDQKIHLALGSDLRSVAQMQQRLVAAQIEMERDYRRLRDAEARYRVLFQAEDEGLVALDGTSLRIIDANEAAGRLFGRPVAKLIGMSSVQLMAASEPAELAATLADVRARGVSEQIVVDAADGIGTLTLSIVPFRLAGAVELLIRIKPSGSPLAGEAYGKDFFSGLPDGHVVTDRQGVVLEANPAFLDLIRVLSPERVVGKSLDNWLGVTGVDVQIILSNLREHRVVSRFQTILRDGFGGRHDVELSAGQIDEAGGTFGFSIREVAAVAADVVRTAGEGGLPYQVEQFADLVGRVPLKDLVRDTSDIIEKMCIESALRLTGNNRASAAEMLGLSRQSLYIKLRRYNLADFTGEE